MTTSTKTQKTGAPAPLPLPVVTVVGSLNLDYIASVEHLPAPGQTVPATDLITRYGGKGANQAVAAARQRTRAHLIGCVGDDDAGRGYCARLREAGIDPVSVRTMKHSATGTALIAVDRKAENTIIVAPGANARLKPAHVRAHQNLISSAYILLLQLEIPVSAAIEAMLIANAAGVPVTLNFSPLVEGFPWGKTAIETLIVNEVEAQHVFGLTANRVDRHLGAWQGGLEAKRVENLIITRGARSTICVTTQGYFAAPTLKVRPVDTVGAGDAFAGAFAAARAHGWDMHSAIRLANCAGALATLEPGAQESIPGREVTLKALRRLMEEGD